MASLQFTGGRLSLFRRISLTSSFGTLVAMGYVKGFLQHQKSMVAGGD
jgi:hypothetical protein